MEAVYHVMLSPTVQVMTTITVKAEILKGNSIICLTSQCMKLLNVSVNSSAWKPDRDVSALMSSSAFNSLDQGMNM